MQKILIIDDFEPFRGMARRVLGRLGHRVIEAPDGRQGLEAFERENPEVVITDLRMPGLDGAQVLAEIKRRSPSTEVVILTGFATERTEQELLKMGAFACLRKPLNLDQIVKVLDRIREKDPPGEARPLAALRVENDRRRALIAGALAKNGLEPCDMNSAADARRLLGAGQLDFLVWEINGRTLAEANALIENREALSEITVVPLLGDAGPDVEAVREAMGVPSSDCLREPLDEEGAAGFFHRLLCRHLSRRNALYKKMKADAVGGIGVSFGPAGELVADLRGRGRQFLYSLQDALRGFPWPVLLLNASWDVVFVSDRLKSLSGFEPERIDLRLWDSLQRQGLCLPPLDDLYRHLARSIRREGGVADPINTAAGGGLMVLALRVIPDPQPDGGLVALLFPDGPGAVVDVPHPEKPALPPPSL